MVKTRLIFFIFILVAVIGFVLPWITEPIRQQEYMDVKIGEVVYHVEVARSAKSIEKGLSYRNTLGADGMVFVLPERTIPRFWMRGMQFGLDFVWIDGATIVSLTENISPPDIATPEAQLPTYSPKAPVTHVLELPAGTIQKNSIRLGERVQFDVQE